MTLPAASLPSGSDKFAEPRDVLIAARKLIEKPQNFSQFEFARDRRGQPCPRGSLEAYSFCTYGALDQLRIRRIITREMQAAAEDILCLAMGGPIADFNDSRTHAEVLAAFDAAIAAAGAA